GFAVVSFYQGVTGQTSCGCMGRLVRLSPWNALGIDGVAIAVLLLGRPDLKPLWDTPRSAVTGALLPLACGLAGILLFSALLFGLASVTFGSVPAALAHFRGDRVAVRPSLIDVGKAESAETREIPVEVANWTDNTVRLIGGTSDCACTVLNDLPVTIPAQETRSDTVRMRMRGNPGIFTRRVGFLVDDEGFRRVDFRITGQITGSPSAAR